MDNKTAVTAVLPDEMNKTAATAVLPDKMNKASSMNRQTMTFPDQMNTLNKYTTNRMPYGKRTPSNDGNQMTTKARHGLKQEIKC